MSEVKTHYEVLGLTPDASLQDVKKRYRELARRYHPDLNPGKPEYHALFLRINQAYETLSDEDRRAVYDYDLQQKARRQAETRTGPAGAAPPGARPNPSRNGHARPAPPGAGPQSRERREAEERRRRAARLLDEARMHYSRGYLREAKRLCQEVLEISRLGGAHEILGDIYSKQGRYADAVQHYTVAAQMLPNQGLIMAKLNRAAARLTGVSEPRTVRSTTNPAKARRSPALVAFGRLAYRMILTTLSLSLILFLMFWWPHLPESRLEMLILEHWTVPQLIATVLDGFLAGMVLASAGWVRPFSGEMTFHAPGPGRRVPLNLILGLFGAVSLPLAFVVYLIVSYLQGYLSFSILTAFGAAAALTCGFVLAAPPAAQFETLLAAGNLLWLTLLCGWYIGDVFRPRWAY